MKMVLTLILAAWAIFMLKIFIVWQDHQFGTFVNKRKVEIPILKKAYIYDKPKF